MFGWRLAVGGGWWRLAVGALWGLSLTKIQRLGVLKDSPGGAAPEVLHSPRVLREGPRAPGRGPRHRQRGTAKSTFTWASSWPAAIFSATSFAHWS